MQLKSKPLRLMAKLAARNKWLYLGSVVCTVFTVTIGFLTPILLAETIDTLLGGEPSQYPQVIAWLGGREHLIANLWIMGVLLVALNLINGLFTYLKGRWTATAGENVARHLRDSLYTHLQYLPFSYHAHAQTGDLIQRCTSDVETVRRFLSVQLIEVVNTLLMIFISVTILWNRHITLTLYTVMLMPILFSAAFIFFGRVTKSFREMDESEGKMSAVLQENLTGMRVVRAFGKEQYEVEKFDAASKDFRKKTYKVLKLLNIYWAGSDAVSITQSMITLLACTFFAVRGEITVGTLLIFTSYVSMLTFPIRQLGRILSDAGKSTVALDRIQGILHETAEEPEKDAVTPDLKGDIVFDHVSFGYEDDHREVLHDLSFTIKGGKTVAILGGTGSGKSTLVMLLQRLFAPTGGAITIGGVPIEKIDRKHLRSHVGLVLQEPFLYSKTIRDNVGIVSRNYEMKQVEAAARTACAQGFIEKSDKGYDTVVGERGVTLSGGQKQRMAIARTLMKDNHILIFDDSLSAVDTQTDAQIRAALKERQQGVTTLIISHRISTLMEADWILVLDKGRLADQGTHKDLISRPGLYQQINGIQTQLEQELTESRARVEKEVAADAGV